MKIWAKLLVDNNIQKDLIYKSDLPLTYENFNIYLTELCNLLDIPTPVVLKYHYFNYFRYHNAVFKQEDFIQSLDYDQLRIENCKED